MTYQRQIKRLRKIGFRVAIHNDYEQEGRFHTFFLLTHPSGIFVKGEGESDEVAITFAIQEAINRGFKL